VHLLHTHARAHTHTHTHAHTHVFSVIIQANHLDECSGTYSKRLAFSWCSRNAKCWKKFSSSRLQGEARKTTKATKERGWRPDGPEIYLCGDPKWICQLWTRNQRRKFSAIEFARESPAATMTVVRSVGRSIGWPVNRRQHLCIGVQCRWMRLTWLRCPRDVMQLHSRARIFVRWPIWADVDWFNLAK